MDGRDPRPPPPPASAELRARERQQTALATLGGLVLAAEAPEPELFQRATELVAAALEVDHVKVLELLPGGEELLLRAGVGWREGLIGRATVGTGRDSQAGFTLQSSAPVIVADLASESRFAGPPLLHDHGVVSGISVVIGPLDAPFGVLGAHTTSRREFSSTDVDFVQSVAHLLATGIERRRAEARNRQLTRLYRTLSEVNQEIVRASDRDVLLARACRILVERGGFVLAWVGFKETDGRVLPAATHGSGDASLGGLVTRWDETPEGRCPAGTAIREERPVVFADCLREPAYAPWRGAAEARGYRSHGAFPIRARGELRGVLSVCAAEANAIGDEESQLLGELATDLGFALGALELDEENRRAQEALRDSEQRYRDLVERGGVAIVATDEKGRLTFFNRPFAEMFGYEPAEIEGRSAADFIHPDDRDLVMGRHRQRIAGKLPPDTYAARCLRKDGTLLHVDVSVSSLEASGRVVGTRVYLRDVTRQRELEAELLQAQKMEAVGRLAGGVAHDFNNMLTAVIGFAEAARDRTEPGDPIRDDLEEILKAAERSATLTRQLLAFSRRQIAAPEVVRVGPHLQAMTRLLERTLGEDIGLSLTFQESDWPVLIDPTQLDQVLVNLAVNARDAMPHGGRLTVETANLVVDEANRRDHPSVEPGEYLLLAVADTGQGMDRPTLERAFEPFFTTKQPGIGTGLGLSTVYGIVKQHGGFIHAHSEPGGGTLIRLYLLRHRPGQEARGRKAPDENGPAGTG